jgi:hypothetical protein
MKSAAIHSSGVHKVESKTYPSFLTLKEGSTFLTKPLFPQGREDVTALRCSEPLRSKVGGPSKVCAKLCGMGPHGDMADGIVINEQDKVFRKKIER